MVSKIKNNSQVVVYEKTDFRDIDNKLINDANIASIDVSFISVTKLIYKLSTLNIDEIVCLIKPQFECGSEISRKYKGIILNKNVHKAIINNIIYNFKENGFYINNLTYSPVCGGDGNIEYLGYFRKNNSHYNYNIEKIIDNSFKTLRKVEKKVNNA